MRTIKHRQEIKHLNWINNKCQFNKIKDYKNLPLNYNETSFYYAYSSLLSVI